MYIFGTIMRAWRVWRDRIRSRNQLRKLDDHMLNDIGLRRDEIDVFVDRNRSRAHMYSV